MGGRTRVLRASKALGTCRLPKKTSRIRKKEGMGEKIPNRKGYQVERDTRDGRDDKAQIKIRRQTRNVHP